MANLLVADVIDNARDLHPLLSRENVPDPLMVRELSRAVGDFYDQIYPRVPAFLAQSLEVDLTDPSFNWDAVIEDVPGLTPPTGIDLTTELAGGWKDLMKGEFWRQTSGPVRGPVEAVFIPWEQRTLGGRRPAFTLRDNALYFLGCAAQYQQFAIFRLLYTPNPADMTLGGSVPLPLDAREPLASRLAVFGLMRLVGNPEFKITQQDIGPFADRAANERREFLTAIFRITQRQRYVMRDVRPDPGGPWGPGLW